MIRQTVIAFALGMNCAAAQTYALDSIWDHELESDGRVFEMTIYPIGDNDRGRRQYHFFTEPYSAISARLEARGDAMSADDFNMAITPLVTGAFAGMDGDHAVHVRAVFDATCFRPHALCAETKRLFREVE